MNKIAHLDTATLDTGVTQQLPDGRLILGDDFLSPEDMMKVYDPNYYDFSYSDRQMANFAETLPNLEMLTLLCSNNYILVATPPTNRTLFKVRSLHNHPVDSEDWYDDRIHNFSRVDIVRGGTWLAIHKGPYPDSRGKTWDAQTALLSDDEHVPNVAEVSYAILAYYKVRGIKLFYDVYVRTSSVSADGGNVHVGNFEGVGLCVSCCWDRCLNDDIGISSSRKLT